MGHPNPVTMAERRHFLRWARLYRNLYKTTDEAVGKLARTILSYKLDLEAAFIYG